MNPAKSSLNRHFNIIRNILNILLNSLVIVFTADFAYGFYLLLKDTHQTLASSLLIPIVSAVRLCKSVLSVFFPCNVIQLSAVLPEIHPIYKITIKVNKKNNRTIF